MIARNSFSAYTWLLGHLFFKTIVTAFSFKKNPFHLFQAIRHLIKQKAKDPYLAPRNAVQKIKGQYYWNQNLPGFPSPAFDQVLNQELARVLGLTDKCLVMAI